MCGQAYSNISSNANLVEFKADAAIHYINQGSKIEHAHVILVLETLDIRGRQTRFHSVLSHIHRVVHSWDGLGCVARGKHIHFKAQIDKLDDQIALGLVLKVAHFFGAKFSICSSEVGKVSRTYLTKIEGIFIIKARISLFCQVFNE